MHVIREKNVVRLWQQRYALPQVYAKANCSSLEKVQKAFQAPAALFHIVGHGVDVLSSNEIEENTAHGTAPAIQLVSLS